jgi:hypothetical protein
MFFKNQLKQKEQNLKEYIPQDPQQFYEDLGLLTHPNTGLPVEKLTAYQIKVWKANRHKYRLVVKSQKVGLTTSVLMELLQHALTDCKGYEILIIAQTGDAAKEHLYTLRSMLRNSTKYAKYMITTRQEGLERDESTKATVMYLRNPDNPNKPTRIIAKGPKEQGIWSWKNVKFILMSDVAITPAVDYSGTINAAMTRLANTNGSIIIETPPRAPIGKVYDIYRQSLLETDKSQPEGRFKVITVTASEAVDAGVISEDFLEGEKARLGSQYSMYYEAEFTSGGGDIFSPTHVDAISSEEYDIDGLGGFNIMGIDPAFGSSSKFGVCILNYNGDGLIRVVFADEYETDYDAIMDTLRALETRFNPIKKIIVDPASPPVVKGLKIDNGEDIDWDAQIRRSKKEGWNWMALMHVLPLAFSKYGREMLANTKYFIDNGDIRIHPHFKPLIMSLHTATEKQFGPGLLDKDRTQHNDIFDAFRLSLFYFRQDKETKRV